MKTNLRLRRHSVLKYNNIYTKVALFPIFSFIMGYSVRNSAVLSKSGQISLKFNPKLIRENLGNTPIALFL